MITAVQQRAEAQCSACVVLGEPDSVRPGQLGPISLFGPGSLVAYLVRANRRSRLFLFRTVSEPEQLLTKVPGVQAAVRLLLVAHTARRIYRARRLLREIEKQGATPQTQSDVFYLRAAATLSSRVPIEHVVATLLRQEVLLLPASTPPGRPCRPVLEA